MGGVDGTLREDVSGVHAFVHHEDGGAADLDPGGRLDFVTGNHRAWVNRVHRNFDAEFLELDFQQVADGRQGLGGIVELFLFGRVQNRDRRQGAFHGAVDKQRRLFLFLHALAWLGRLGRCRGNHCRHVFFTLGHVLAQGLLALDQALLDLGLLAFVGDGRRDHVMHAIIDFTQLRDQLLTLGTGRPPAIGRALEQFEQVESDLAGDAAAGNGVVHAVDTAQKGGLAAARRPDEGGDPALVDLQVDRLQRVVLSIVEIDIPERHLRIEARAIVSHGRRLICLVHRLNRFKISAWRGKLREQGYSAPVRRA